MIFSQSEIAYLTQQPLGRIATMQPSGTLQVSPVGFRFNPDLNTIDVQGYRMAESRKFRNVAENGRVAFVVDDLASTRPWRPRCVEIRGHAEASSESDGTPIIRIYPERVISFGLDQENRSAHELRINARDVK